MAYKVYLSPENRVAPHGKYWGYKNIYENDVCVSIADYCRIALERCGFAVKVGKTGVKIQQRVEEGIAWGADYYMPIHTNAMGDGTKEGTAQGCLVLYYGGNKGASYKASTLVYKRLKEIYPYNKDRGLVANTTFYEIIKTPMLSVYPECAFHDNGKDAKWLYENKEAIGEALCKGVCDYYGVKYVEPVANPNAGAVPNPEYDALVAECEAWKEKYNALVTRLKKLVQELGG